MNKRAPEMWEQIISHVNFRGKSVIDLGCGTGDFLFRACQAGAAHVHGVDVDRYTAREALNNSKSVGCHPVVTVSDISDFIADSEKYEADRYDIGICFSVIPYLSNPIKALSWLCKNTDIALIECQYRGDGPGPSSLTNDDDMSKYLGIFWDDVKNIGSTDVRIRPARRTIWMCQKKS